MKSAPKTRARKYSRAEELEHAARARAAIMAYMHTHPDEQVTFDALKKACVGVPGARPDNVVYRMVKNQMLKEVPLVPPVGRYKIAYALPGAEPTPPPEPATVGEEAPTRRPYTRRGHTAVLDKPIVVVTDKTITVDYPHMRVIVQVVPT